MMARTPRKEGAGGTVSLITATLRGLPELDQEAGGCRAFGLVWQGYFLEKGGGIHNPITRRWAAAQDPGGKEEALGKE